MEILHKSPGLEIFSDEMAEKLGTDTDSIRSCISNLRREHPEYPLEVCVRGRSWRYLGDAEKKAEGMPNPLKAKEIKPKRIFEELAVTKAGELLIQDDKGTVYLAKEL